MKQLRSIFIVPVLLFTITNACSQNTSRENSSVVFLASTPCSKGTRPLPGIPVNAVCELIKWKLVLYQDAFKKSPISYKLHCIYGLPKQGTTGLIGGGKLIEMEGQWTIVKGTASKPGAIIYQLHDPKTNRTISFLKLNDDLLHLLDSDLHLMIGSAAWSYTFNRTGNK
ncbi:hypothetical protein [Chitinophaga sp. GbtcB8]|uniref:hypothetical protein n=1 Tax=Chitinophaga sp. GbtcB8 TaxID=2824753 RepID=UPI001C2FA327|nr:hypothetical protein [Chitinophaga sp. GbtcB8]